MHTLQMIILPFIPILALIVQTSVTLQEILDYKAEVADIEAQVSKCFVKVNKKKNFTKFLHRKT